MGVVTLDPPRSTPLQEAPLPPYAVKRGGFFIHDSAL